MNLIRPNLYVGGSDDVMSRLKDTKRAGVTAVLNVADDIPTSKDAMWNFQCIHVPLKDNTKNNPQWLIDHAVKSLDLLLAAGKCVLVHCRLGINRSPTICALHISRAQRIPFEEAWRQIRLLRPQVYEHSRTLPDGFH